MPSISFTASQQKIIDAPLSDSLFIEGPAHAGKTTAALARLNAVFEEFPGYQVLILVPQQSLGHPYRRALYEGDIHSGSVPKITTMSGLLRELTHIFWPLVGASCGFSNSRKKPAFLSMETAQYCMAQIVDPLLEKGYFQSVTIQPNRLYSQIIDNLNKTAIHGLKINEIADRLTLSSINPVALGASFTHVQECALLFRKFCLAHNLIDFSLLLKIAEEFLLQNDLCQRYLQSRYRVLIADNIEEDTPFTHKFIQHQLQAFDSATLIYDHQGGFRSFLGADAATAYALKDSCERSIELSDMLDEKAEIRNFRSGILSCIAKDHTPNIPYFLDENIHLQFDTFLPEMVANVADKIAILVENGTQPDQIAVLSPYLSDALKFTLTEKLGEYGIPAFSSRPSRSYISSRYIRSILTLAKIAHPDWGYIVSHYEFRDCLMSIISDLDIMRAEHAVQTLFPSHPNEQIMLRSFDEISDLSKQETITFAHGKKLESLRLWLENYRHTDPVPLDLFLQQIFGELLSQPGFAFHREFEAADHIDKLILSIRAFRSFAVEAFKMDDNRAGQAYISSLLKGLIPSSFAGEHQTDGCVLITPAYTFLMQNRAVEYQFWLDIGSLGWWERLYQPLTNPYVYRADWQAGDVWGQEQDYTTNQQVMSNLINGLLLRCKCGLFASVIQTNEFGAQNHGPLLQAFQTYLKRCRYDPVSDSHV